MMQMVPEERLTYEIEYIFQFMVLLVIAKPKPGDNLTKFTNSNKLDPKQQMELHWCRDITIFGKTQLTKHIKCI